MASTWQKTQEFYNWKKRGDPRTDPWPVVFSPPPVALVSTCYLPVVAPGPSFMRRLELRALLVAYNLAMVALPSYMFCEVFLILSKKQEQVTFLHMYHHGSMLFSWWSGVKYMPGGQAFFIGMLNSFVCIFMYGSYSALASLGPRMRRHVWWKHYLTILQLCQFVAIAAHSSYNLFTECPFPDGFNTSVFLYILALFLHFYYQTYLRGKQEKLT